jgi:hypothetical protein
MEAAFTPINIGNIAHTHIMQRCTARKLDVRGYTGSPSAEQYLYWAGSFVIYTIARRYVGKVLPCYAASKQLK